MRSDAVIVGVGMVTRDNIYRDGRYQLSCVGGTCGNVISAASSFSSRCFLVSRVGDDDAGRLVFQEMHRLGVHTDFLFVEQRGTPCIVGRVSTRNDPPSHNYTFRNPETGVKFPRYRALTQKQARQVMDQVPTPDLFYCDRLNDATIAMACTYAERGSNVMVEPSDSESARRVSELSGVITILKASREHLSLESPLWSSSGAAIRILTLGADGVAFAVVDGTETRGIDDGAQWERLAPRINGPIVDTIGAGDAFSGALIGRLFTGVKTTARHSRSRVKDAVQFAQDAAERTCRGLGPRWVFDTPDSPFAKNRTGETAG